MLCNVMTFMNSKLEVSRHKDKIVNQMMPERHHGMGICCWRGSASVKTTYSNTVNSIKVTTSAQREAPDPINVSFVKMLSSLALHCREKTHQNTTILHSSHSISQSNCLEIQVNYHIYINEGLMTLIALDGYIVALDINERPYLLIQRNFSHNCEYKITKATIQARLLL